MNTRTISWIILIFTLFLTTFGILWCFTIIISVTTFLIGLISLLYIQQGDVEKFYRKCTGNPLVMQNISDGGLKQIVNLVTSPKDTQKTDKRVTGSELIDSSLQEIFGYIIRDYVTPWYHLISTDTELSDLTVKRTAQSLAINISNRIKEIDWIPYLTTRLVDDAASHLRLFKQARTKANEKHKTQKNSPHKDQKLSPKRTHKRNKSETDVSWCFVNKTFSEQRKETERNNAVKANLSDKYKKNILEDYFFDLEYQMENNLICRDLVSISIVKEKEFLAELIELLLYILLPDEDFQCKSLRFLLREVFVNCVVWPLFSMISEPDFINQAIIWFSLREASLPSEIFLTTLRISDNSEELKCARELVSKEIQLLRSRDSGGECDLSIKQQLNSLFFVAKLIESRLTKLQNSKNSDYSSSNEYLPLENVKAIKLPLDMILKNNVALSYFIDYVTSIGQQAYLFFYLNIEGWKVSVEQQLSDIQINKMKGIHENVTSIHENIRVTAMNIYEQYLGQKSQHKIQLKPALVQILFFKIRNLTEPPSELWFDEVQNAVYEKMKIQNEFLPGFHRSTAYFKLLGELDLVQQVPAEDDDISINSLEGLELNSNDKQKSDTDSPKYDSDNLGESNYSSLNTKQLRYTASDSLLTVESVQKSAKHVRSLSDITDLALKSDRIPESSQIDDIAGVIKVNSDHFIVLEDQKDEKHLKTGEFTLSVKIIETGVVCEKGKTFGIYAIHVSRQYDTGFLEEWHIYRRYSDFYDLHTKIKDKYPDLSKLPFPGKKTFHNMDRAVLERRMRMLGSYLHELCQSNVISFHHGLRDLLMTFLEQGEYDRATSGGPISNTIDTIVNPFKSGMKSIKNMPEQLINTVDEVVENISKVFHGKSNHVPEASKVGASLDIESDDNIPLRIMLLLMDEVFDLKSRNQWLRRRIVTILRQIVRTMFGDIVNRRILDYVSVITSPKNVAHYLHTFKQSYWPNGVKVEKKAERDEGTKYRTRVAAKVALLSSLSDELKHIIGSETTRRGILTIFELFQRPILNKRLIYVLLEGILTTLLPEKNMTDIFQKLHSRTNKQIKKRELNVTPSNR